MTGKSDIAVILVAAGRGSRMGGGVPKQWRMLNNHPVLAHTIDAFRAAGLENILLVTHEDDRERAETLGVPHVLGGSSRTQSVRAALEALSDTPPGKVLIHDGARPLVEPEVIHGVVGALAQHPAAAPALPVTDALWQGENGHVAGLRDRDDLYRAQTPQGFDYARLLAAYRSHPGDAADDVAIARAAGMPVWITQGSESNIKLTYPADFERAERALAERQAIEGQTMDIRLGNGYDVHAFTEGDHVWLCGVKVPHSRALLGHSDADVGMHALTDAIYGAMAEGDIGRHFPPSDPQWKGAESHIFLRHAAELARSKGYAIANCDVTLVCERPKIGPHANAMRDTLAQIMAVEVDRVSVKATTSERLGFTGREEGIAALATATLVRT